MSDRFIQLRRPPILSLVDEPWVPDGVDLDEVERRWRTLCDANPAYFDGRLCHVMGVHRNGHGGAVIHLADCAYRFHAVQTDDFDLGVRPLGVKGLTRRNDEFLVGRRAASVAHYPGSWEFAPGGVVEPGRDPADVLIRELYEETGLRPAQSPRPLAVVYDHVVRTWELVFEMAPADSTDPPPTTEYAELRWTRAVALPAPRSPIADRLIDLATRLADDASNA